MHLLKQIALLSLILGLGMAGCAKKENTEIIGGADEPTTIVIEPEISKDEPKETESDIITDDQAIVTEFVPGITEDEERTDESFNVKDYISKNDPSAEKVSSVPGTWATASMGYEYNGDVLPEYHVQFTDSEVIYGHMLDGEFMADHTAKIIDLENTASGGYRIQVESSDGGHYTYQTSDNDDNVLEYYETWDEDDFHSMYRGGASLWKID